MFSFAQNGGRWGINVDAKLYPHLALLLDSNGKVGIDHFREQYGPDAVAPAKGNLDSLDSLDSDIFDAKAVHPTIRAFFEQTSDAKVSYVGRQDPILTPFHRLVYTTIASRIEQLAIPPVWGQTQFMKCSNAMVDTDPDRPGFEYRAWQRRMSDDRPFYTAAIATMPHEWRPKLFKRAYRMVYFLFVLPLPRSNLSVVFSPRNLGNGGMDLSSTESFGGGLAGTYAVVPRGRQRLSFAQTPMREHFVFRPLADAPASHGAAEDSSKANGKRLSVLHSQYWGDLLLFQLDYTIVMP